MATDQGKTSNITGLGVLADATGKPHPGGRHHHLPAALHARHFRRRSPARTQERCSCRSARRPILRLARRRTAPTSSRSASGGAPIAIRAPARTSSSGHPRDRSRVRNNVGLLDASTLGKIEIKGPDAAEFLDRIYTNDVLDAESRALPLRPDDATSSASSSTTASPSVSPMIISSCTRPRAAPTASPPGSRNGCRPSGRPQGLRHAGHRAMGAVRRLPARRPAPCSRQLARRHRPLGREASPSWR